jgi:hypothetical protein
MKRAAVALLPFLFVPHALAVELADYVGEWTGKGTYSEKGNGERSGRLTCRLVITAPRVDMIEISGRCAAPAGARRFRTEVTKTGPGTIAGLDASEKKPRASTGRLDSAGLRLDGEDSAGPFFLELSSPAFGAMEMRSSTTTAIQTQGAEVRLTKAR